MRAAHVYLRPYESIICPLIVVRAACKSSALLPCVLGAACEPYLCKGTYRKIQNTLAQSPLNYKAPLFFKYIQSTYLLCEHIPTSYVYRAPVITGALNVTPWLTISYY